MKHRVRRVFFEQQKQREPYDALKFFLYITHLKATHIL